MFLALITTIVDWISEIFWTKSLKYWVWWKIHDLLGYFVWLILAFYFILSWVKLFEIDLFLLVSTSFLLVLAIITAYLQQKIYTKEKISVVMPFTNVNKILSLILSYFLFSDVSLTSLIITLIAIIFIIWFTVDYNKWNFPKNSLLIYWTEILISIDTIFSWYLLFNYNEELFFIVFVFIWIIFLSILTYILGEHKTLKWLNKNFWINRYIWALWWVSWFLWLVIIKNLWISTSILLSFLWIWVTLLLSYLILKDKPSKKDLILTIIVTILVWLWYYYS